ncbi:GCN5-related N-acetyltransferase [Deinococcus geothermalis DSM 11300]|uniref:GCN5-related N-acetyltransferase n=2 Tax=Deinococcaceae TaxID=183710 RepID=Q1IWJ6_DEIGD|nr:GCN5-related N-acetyltransferase [Deinococcus geothermalis DSM 11300]
MSTPLDSPASYQAALDAPDQLPFVVEVGGALAGSTRYGDIRAAHRGLEIGWTWLHPRWHGSGVNRRMKRLLLAQAFEELGMERVQLKTDILNTRSQRAIEKLGAVREGVLRRHLRRPDGSMRDTVMYSVTREEWPEVKARLSSVAGALPADG